MAIVPMMLAAVVAPEAAPLWERVPPVAYAAPCQLPEAIWSSAPLIVDDPRGGNTIGFDGVRLSWNGLAVDERSLAGYLHTIVSVRPKPQTVLYSTGADCEALQRIAAMVAREARCRPSDCTIVFAPPPRPVAPPTAPPPPPAGLSRKAAPTGAPQTWITNDDYPAAALRAGQAGMVSFRLEIGTDGAVTGCTVTGSSGSKLLDDKTCELMLARARFKPALDAQGKPIVATWTSRMRWELPSDYVPPVPVERLSWTHILQFTVGEDGAISGCKDEYFGNAGTARADVCAGISEMPMDMRETIRGNSTGPVTVQLRSQQSVSGIPLAASPAVPGGFTEVGKLSVTFDIDAAGSASNCHEVMSPEGMTAGYSACAFMAPYAPGPGPASVTIIQSWYTTGDPKLMQALQGLGGKRQ